jgi:hypothetical protein
MQASCVFRKNKHAGILHVQKNKHAGIELTTLKEELGQGGCCQLQKVSDCNVIL